jgi:hypothetical protein
VRYKISDQSFRKIQNDLGNAERYKLGDDINDSFKGSVVDVGKLFLHQVTKTIAYTAKVSLNIDWEKDWEKDWEITVVILD